MVEMLGEMEFSLYGREGGVLVDGAAPLKYLGRPLDQWMTNGRQQGGTPSGHGSSGGGVGQYAVKRRVVHQIVGNAL